MISPTTLSKIENIIGKKNLFTSQEDRICYAYDATNLFYLPDAVAIPGTAEEIDAIMQLANQEKFPVTPRGAGTGMTGGALAVNGGLVLALTRLNRILEIDTENLIAIVEPGVITGDLQGKVEKVGLFYPPDPSSLKFSTMGGNVAECAGGARAVKYGVTKDYIIGLEVILPTGGIISTGVRTRKGVVGYDLTKLFVGSEGTLGIITKIILKLLPLPEARKTLLAIFDRLDTAMQTVSGIISARIIPAALEFMDQTAISCVEDYLPPGLPREAGALLLIEVDGRKEAVESEANKVFQLCRKFGAIDIRTAGDESEASLLWQARRAVSPALFKLRPHKISEDIVVPRSHIAEMVSRAKAIGTENDLIVLCFGHAGDGNIHINIMIDREDRAEVNRAQRAREQIFRTAVELGGTLSGEHGIGITKSPFLGLELNPLAVETMKKIKTALDPNNILNPGKVFPIEPGKS
ncbi:MAG: FAD-linked oxidase C-terminal domain-containing protein [Deltaproteobacteria bacterium]|nr:FAD-linked oxidase C-terminal domain-containing protein [Deltaproteobacteria bacterium]